MLVAFSFIVAVCGTRTTPQQGKIGKTETQPRVLLLSAYDRLVKAAARVEKITGDASLLSKGKHSKVAARVLVEDPKKISSDALHLVTQAYAVMKTKAPTLEKKPTNELRTAYHEILAAAEGIELVRRNADAIAPEEVAAFALEMQKDPDEVEADVKQLEKDMEEAEEDVGAAEKKLEETVAAAEKHDDKADTTEAEAANKAAKQALAEADHEQHGGDELVGKVEGDKKRQEEGAAKKAEAKGEVEAATAEHKAADAAHEEADKVDDAHEEKIEKAEEEHEEATEKHEAAVEAHNEHPEAEKVKTADKSGAMQLASYAAPLILAMFF